MNSNHVQIVKRNAMFIKLYTMTLKLNYMHVNSLILAVMILIVSKVNVNWQNL